MNRVVRGRFVPDPEKPTVGPRIEARAVGHRVARPVRTPSPSYSGVTATLATSTRGSAPWGTLAAIDLHGCERRRLEDPSSIRFVHNVIEAIGMRAHGPLRLERFGDGELARMLSARSPGGLKASQHNAGLSRRLVEVERPVG